MKFKLVVMGLLSTLATMFGCGSSAKKVSEGKTVSGPFEIRWEVFSTQSGGWFNNGGDHHARILTSYFSVYHHGKVVVIRSVDIRSKGKNIDFFWQALFLKDSKQTAVLVGTHSIYLITEENSELKVIPVHEQPFGGFAFFQWLDSNRGQPGRTETIVMGDDSKRERFLAGGRYLMVNGRAVLDTETLRIHPFQPTGNDGSQAMDQYNASTSAILQTSPDGKKLMLIGTRNNKAGDILFSEYAMVVINILTNDGYAVPFSRTDTRFFSVYDATPQWIETFLEWQKNTDGGYTLVKRKLDKLPNWKGRYSHGNFSRKVSNYELIPVKQSMLNAFYDFLKRNYDVTETSREAREKGDDEKIKFKIDGKVLSLYFRKKEQTIWFQGEVEGQIKPFADAFDAELAKGEYQEHFGRYPE